MPSTKPLTLVQVHTFYPGFLSHSYAALPHMAEQSFQEQIDWLLGKGFSAPHMFTRPLAELGLSTFQIIANCVPAQASWLKENGATDIGNVTSAYVLKRQIDMIKPDLLYINDCITFDSQFVRSIERHPKLVFGWRGFPPPATTDWSSFDFILTSFDNMFDWAKERGAKKVIRFHPGFPDFCSPVESPRVPDLDVVFSGSVTRQHAYRIQLLNYIGGLSREPAPEGFSFGLYMGDASALDPTVAVLNRGAVWGDEMIATLRRAKIVVNIDIDAFNNQPPNMRLIEATGAGAFLLTPYHPQLSEFFAPGEEIETFRTPAELIAKIRYFLDHDEEREAIALAGQKRCQKDHALSQRARWLKDILETELKAVAER